MGGALRRRLRYFQHVGPRHHAGAASARLAVGLLTGAAVLANLALLAAAARREPRLAAHRDGLSRFLNGAGALGAFVSLAAVIWQGLPILIIGY